ncbi:MAG: hypothetical protein WCD86_11925 [Ktedonobacteraceae bacterium]
MGYEAYQKLIGKRVLILAPDRYSGNVGVIQRIYLIYDKPFLVDIKGVQVFYRGDAFRLLDEVGNQEAGGAEECGG